MIKVINWSSVRALGDFEQIVALSIFVVSNNANWKP